MEWCPACSNQISRKLQGQKLKGNCGKHDIVISEIGPQYANKYSFSLFSCGFFPEKCGALNDEQGESFHRDICAKRRNTRKSGIQ
jgi:hypothetical protein